MLEPAIANKGSGTHADILECACIIGLRIIYVGAFAFELRIFLERRHFE